MAQNFTRITKHSIAIRPAGFYDGRLFVCCDQSGRTSAPTRPHAVHTI
jgi:hypothetical protein